MEKLIKKMLAWLDMRAQQAARFDAYLEQVAAC